MKQQNQKGFTLIELMIVVAIIGILAAVAIPAYQDYIARAQVAEAIQLLGGAKTPLEEYYSTKNIWPSAATTPVTLENLGAKTSGTYVTTVVATLGVVEATMKGTGVQSGIADAKIQLAYSTALEGWVCSTVDMAEKYLPSSCKQ